MRRFIGDYLIYSNQESLPARQNVLDEGLAAALALLEVALEPLRAAVIRILDDALALRVELPQQFHYPPPKLLNYCKCINAQQDKAYRTSGTALGGLDARQVAVIRFVHAQYPVELLKVLFADLRMFREFGSWRFDAKFGIKRSERPAARNGSPARRGRGSSAPICAPCHQFFV